MFRPIWSRWKEWRLTQPVHVHYRMLRARNLTLQCVWNTRTIVISTSNCHLELLQYLSLYHACFLFICMYLWPYYWINKVCHIFSLFVSNRSSHNQMTEYFEEYYEYIIFFVALKLLYMGSYGKIWTKQEPIRTLGFALRLICHIITCIIKKG